MAKLDQNLTFQHYIPSIMTTRKHHIAQLGPVQLSPDLPCVFTHNPSPHLACKLLTCPRTWVTRSKNTSQAAPKGTHPESLYQATAMLPPNHRRVPHVLLTGR